MNTEIQKLFVRYEVAIKLKEAGFDEPCIAWYLRDKKIQFGLSDDEGIDTFKNSESTCHNPLISAPLYQQAINFLNKSRYFFIQEQPCGDWWIINRDTNSDFDFILNTPEEAIIKMLKLIENKQK